MFDHSHLNEVQRNAIELCDRPMMVLAGAGSGKTRMLVAKMAYLLGEKRIPSFKILALTFSNKAAKEMRDRVERMCGAEAASLTVTTFHSFCSRLLRMEADYLGLAKSFSIYDDDESLLIIKNILGKYGISPKEISPHQVLFYIDDLKNKGYFPGKVGIENLDIDIDHPFFKYYTDYEQELHKSNALDFGGLICSLLNLFDQHPQILKRYQNRYEYILVDEYQDTNRAQFDLIRLLAGSHQRICVVGDEDQSIYSWRGADINNILDFEKLFPEVDIIKLEQNYRSTGNIINAASSVISNNVLRKGKNLWTENPQGEKVIIKELESEKDEASFVVSNIKKQILKNSSLKYFDIAIFYRNNYQSRPLEDALRLNNIPYRIIGGIKFYDRKEIKDILGYLRLVVNPNDSLALSRIINVPARGIGATSLKKLEDLASQLNISLWATLEKINYGLEDYGIRLTPKIKQSLKNFSSFINDCITMNGQRNSPYSIYEKIIHESGYLEELRAIKDYESAARLENIEEFGHAIKEFSTDNSEMDLAQFIESITLDRNTEANNENKGEISLMTIHGAKGLEFPISFLVGAEEGIFPSNKSIEVGQTAIEEERRLFYVAMTRAMKTLYITFARGRYLWGQLKFNGPSRFLFEIPKECVEWDEKNNNEKPLAKNAFDDYEFSQVNDLDSFKIASTPPPKAVLNRKFEKGNRVVHSVYGPGTVLNTEGDGQDEKVLISFPDGAKKKFLVKFAPITLV